MGFIGKRDLAIICIGKRDLYHILSGLRVALYHIVDLLYQRYGHFHMPSMEISKLGRVGIIPRTVSRISIFL
jgi:hypothetical protein